MRWRDTITHAPTHTLHYGMGVLEGVHAYDIPQGTAAFRLQAHTDRLFSSARITNIQILYSHGETNEATRVTVRESNLENACIRPVVFYGSGGMGLRASGPKIHVIIAAWSWDAHMGEGTPQQDIKMRISSLTRHHANISMTRAKSNGAYINSMLAPQEAIFGGADEAMMLDPEGYAAEGSDENISIIKDGMIYIPEITACLNGTTRNTVLILAAEYGFKLVRKHITHNKAYIADEALFTGTTTEITPTYEVDDHKTGTSRHGLTAERLQKAYSDLASDKVEAHAEWCTLAK